MDKFAKAQKLTEDDRVKFEGLVGSSLYFQVFTDNEHQVIFRITNNRWMCDCQWSSLHKKDCSHILACKQWLKNRESDKIKTKYQG
jgi:hypothetical protein